MSTLALIILAAYFGLLVAVSFFTSRKADGETFFTGNRTSPWYLDLARGTVRRERPADRQLLFHCVATDWCILSLVPGRRGIAIGSL